jgi:uncharacterized membrane protein YvlD (DUF360 family)
MNQKKQKVLAYYVLLFFTLTLSTSLGIAFLSGPNMLFSLSDSPVPEWQAIVTTAFLASVLSLFILYLNSKLVLPALYLVSFGIWLFLHYFLTVAIYAYYFSYVENWLSVIFFSIPGFFYFLLVSVVSAIIVGFIKKFLGKKILIWSPGRNIGPNDVTSYEKDYPGTSIILVYNLTDPIIEDYDFDLFLIFGTEALMASDLPSTRLADKVVFVQSVTGIEPLADSLRSLMNYGVVDEVVSHRSLWGAIKGSE